MKNFFIILLFIFANISFAATEINLRHQSTNFLQSLSPSFSSLQKTETETDANQITHTKFNQLYHGYPVWGATAITHTSNNKSLAANKPKMNGIIYQDLSSDLNNPPANFSNPSQRKNALQHAISIYTQKNKRAPIFSKTNDQLLIFVDQNKKAHWAYFIQLLIENQNVLLEKPTYILDAANFSVYQEWNDLKTTHADLGGGFGGNQKIGKKTFPSFSVERDDTKKNHVY